MVRDAAELAADVADAVAAALIADSCELSVSRCAPVSLREVMTGELYGSIRYS